VRIISSAVHPVRAFGQTSCTMCPTPARTTSWNLPCICPIISSLSRRSAPARTNSRAVRADRNLLDRPVNHAKVTCQRDTPRSAGQHAVLTRPIRRRRAQRGAPYPGEGPRFRRWVLNDDAWDRDTRGVGVADRMSSQAECRLLRTRNMKRCHKTYCHSIASSWLLNPAGRVSSRLFIIGRASMVNSVPAAL
jgi:hypothetical protein